MINICLFLKRVLYMISEYELRDCIEQSDVGKRCTLTGTQVKNCYICGENNCNSKKAPPPPCPPEEQGGSIGNKILY